MENEALFKQMEENYKVFNRSVDHAHIIIDTQQPKFNQVVDMLSTNSLRRVLKAMVSYPFNEKHLKKSVQAEIHALQLGQNIMTASVMIQNRAYSEHIDEIMTAIENNKPKETENG